MTTAAMTDASRATHRRPRVPGALLLQPVTLGALALLLLNDHVIKRQWPGALSGKMSDIAGMVVFPLVLHAILELGGARIGRPLSTNATRRALVGVILLTMAAFTLVELTAAGDVAYRVGVGSLQWPFQALASLATGDGLPVLRPVQATRDPTDVLTIPFGLVALFVWLVDRD